jgi:hypothetical protein
MALLLSLVKKKLGYIPTIPEMRKVIQEVSAALTELCIAVAS